MPENTENHQYNRPDQGTEDWHIPLNDNFGSLEVDAPVRDVESNVDNYTPHDGALFIADDTAAVYEGDGSSWTQTGTIIPDITGATFVSIGDESSDLSNSEQHVNLAESDRHPPQSHGIASGRHGSDTLSSFNSKISDATLDDASNMRPPQTHGRDAHDELLEAIQSDGTTLMEAFGIREGEGVTFADVGGNVTEISAEGGGSVDLTQSPNDGIEYADLPSGESASVTQVVPDGSTITVQAWGGYTVPGGTAPTDLNVELVLPDGTVHHSENTVWTANSDGISGASYSNTSGGAQVIRLRLMNNTGTDFTEAAGNDGVGADFGYEVA